MGNHLNPNKGLMNSPFFSIIIPVYNVAPYLEKCVKSITEQSFSDFECILVDDGSIDGSAKLCDELQQADKRIKIIHKQNEGVAVARNKGIQQANGAYLLFVDSDDTLKPSILSNIANKIKETDADIAVFGYERITESGQVLLTSVPNERFSKKIMQEKSSDLTFLLWNKAYKRSLFENINLKTIEGITFSEDSYLTLALQKQTEKITFLNEIGYSYLCRATSVTQKMSLKNHTDRIYAVTLMDSLYSHTEKRPKVLKYIKFDTKFFYIDPNIYYEKEIFLSQCKQWRTTFSDCNACITKKIGTKKMYLYVLLVRIHLDNLAYMFYSKKNKEYKQ